MKSKPFPFVIPIGDDDIRDIYNPNTAHPWAQRRNNLEYHCCECAKFMGRAFKPTYHCGLIHGRLAMWFCSEPCFTFHIFQKGCPQ